MSIFPEHPHPSDNDSQPKTALVVEGGGMRGIFTAGVLDAFQDKRVHPFDGYYGVSAGALNLSSFIAGQRGRNLDLYTSLCLSPEFISLSRHLKGGSLFDLDWFFRKINLQHSLDLRRFRETLKQRRFTVVTSCMDTGQPVYREISDSTPREELMDTLKASSALPMIYRRPVSLGNHRLMDGSLSDPLPVHKAVEDGYRKIVLLRTRPSTHRKKNTAAAQVQAWQNRRKPAIAKLIRQHHQLYNASTEFIEGLEKQGIELIQVAPKSTLKTTRSTRNRNLLVADYHQGYQQGYNLAEQFNR